MSLILMGTLSRFSATEVVRFIVGNRKNGVLTIEAGGGYRIRFEAGRITGASFESSGPDSTAAELVVRALLQDNGMFSFIDARPVDERKVDLDPLPLIEQAQQRISESEAFDPSSVLLPVRERDLSDTFSSREVDVIRESNEGATAGDIIQRCGMDEETAKRVIGSLIRRGWMVVRKASEADQVPVKEQASTAAGADTTETEKSEPATPPPVTRVALLTIDDTDSTSFPLFDDAQTIGRGKDSTIQIDDKSVSTTHARISPDRDGHLLEDLGSSNGTFVNGKRVEKAVLQDGDRVRLGKIFMVYMIPSEVQSETGAADKSS